MVPRGTSVVAVDDVLPKSIKTHTGGEGGVTDLASRGGGGAGAGTECKSEDTASTDIERSSNIVLGFQLQKIYREGDIVQTADNVAGRTLDRGEHGVLENIKVVDGFGIEEGSKRKSFSWLRKSWARLGLQIGSSYNNCIIITLLGAFLVRL